MVAERIKWILKEGSEGIMGKGLRTDLRERVATPPTFNYSKGSIE